MFTLKFETDNAAFEYPMLREETARILRAIAAKLDGGGEGGFVLDYNGNSIGEWSLAS